MLTPEDTAREAGNHAEILCDVYADLGRVHQDVPVGFGYSAEVKK